MSPILWTECLLNGIHNPFMFAFVRKRNDYNRKAATVNHGAAPDNKGCSDYYWWTLSFLSLMVVLGHKNHTYLSINSSAFSSGDIFKSKAWKSTLNRDNSRDASQKNAADLDWQLYIWGRYDLVLMLRLATWLMWPRSVLTGHWAAGHRGQSWKVGKWLRLHSCDWLRPSGQPPMISHVPAERARALIPQWKHESTTEMIKRVWKNNGDELQWTWRMRGAADMYGDGGKNWRE